MRYNNKLAVPYCGTKIIPIVPIINVILLIRVPCFGPYRAMVMATSGVYKNRIMKYASHAKIIKSNE